MQFVVRAGGGSGLSPYILVTAEPNKPVTCSKGQITLPGTTDENGNYKFIIPEIGSWTVTCEGESLIIDVLDPQYEADFTGGVYGIQRDITSSSPAWERTDDAVGFSATASVGTVAGHSDFDDIYPWSEIQREILSNGNVMVKIPKFHYRRWRDGNIEHIQIAQNQFTGSSIHPAFLHNGQEQEYIYVGAYETVNNNKSLSGYRPTASATMDTFRNNAKSLGNGWGLFDGSSYEALRDLLLVEYADNNSQAVIGQGMSGVTRTQDTGSCDSVPNLTGRPEGTDNRMGIVYRGVENLWGNIGTFIDGVLFEGETAYVCNNQSSYNSSDTTGYTPLNFNLGDTNGYIAQMGLDENNPWAMFPTQAGASENTGFCDYYVVNTAYEGIFVSTIGGAYNGGTQDGISCLYKNHTDSTTSTEVGARLLYIPSYFPEKGTLGAMPLKTTKLKINGVKYVLFTRDHAGYPNNAQTLLAEFITNSTSYGSNANYQGSNLQAQMQSVYTGISEYEKGFILKTDRAYRNLSGAYPTFEEYVFPLTSPEVGGTADANMGTNLGFNSNEDRKQTNEGGTAQSWWLADATGSSGANYVYSDGSLSTSGALSSYGVFYAMNLSANTPISDEPDSEGYYTIKEV